MSKKHKDQLSGINKWLQTKNRHELYDFDYLSQLTEKELAWLSNFNKEFINADFTHTGKRIHKNKKAIKIKKTNGKKIEYDVFKKDCEDRNNARNRDAFTITKANRYLQSEEKAFGAIEKARSTDCNEVEDVLIDIIDLKNSQ